MKKITLFLMLTIMSCLLVNAKDYKIKIVKGACEVLVNNKWRTLKNGETVASSVVIKATEDGTVVSVESFKGGVKFHEKGKSKSLDEIVNMLSSPNGKTFSELFWGFISFLKPSPPNTVSAEGTGHGNLGDCDFPCDSLGASLLAKMNGMFEIEKITDSMSDYDILMDISDIDHSSKKHITIYNLSADSLYTIILEISEEHCKPIKSNLLDKKHLLKIADNSFTELPEEIEINPDCEYVLLACKNNFNIEDLLNTIASDCECTLKSDMPIGIYRVK